MKIGFYHHGSQAKPEIAKAVSGLRATGYKILPRNADLFRLNELEKFDLVVTDKGANTEAIAKAYGKVQSVEDFLENPPALPKKEEKSLSPDKQVEKPKAKKQG